VIAGTLGIRGIVQDLLRGFAARIAKQAGRALVGKVAYRKEAFKKSSKGF
jgi:hypothetical protein